MVLQGTATLLACASVASVTSMDDDHIAGAFNDMIDTATGSRSCCLSLADQGSRTDDSLMLPPGWSLLVRVLQASGNNLPQASFEDTLQALVTPNLLIRCANTKTLAMAALPAPWALLLLGKDPSPAICPVAGSPSGLCSSTHDTASMFEARAAGCNES
jgi:hypothetical protein